MEAKISFSFVAALAMAVLSGCATSANGPGMASATGSDQRMQACVERALSGNPEPALLPTALAHFQDNCAAGDMGACSTLGMMRERGLAAPVDKVRAYQLYEQACSAGNAGGCANLGLMLVGGAPVPAAPFRAAKLLHRACSLGHARACFALGSMHQEGNVVDHAPERAAELFTTGCELRHAPSCFVLGQIHQASNPHKARVLYANACREGYEAGCQGLDAMFVARRTANPPAPRAASCAGGYCGTVASR